MYYGRFYYYIYFIVGIIEIFLRLTIYNSTNLKSDTRKIFVPNIKTVDESNSARVIITYKYELNFDGSWILYAELLRTYYVYNNKAPKSDWITEQSNTNTDTDEGIKQKLIKLST